MDRVDSMANKKSGQGRSAAARKAMRAKRRRRKIAVDLDECQDGQD